MITICRILGFLFRGQMFCCGRLSFAKLYLSIIYHCELVHCCVFSISLCRTMLPTVPFLLGGGFCPYGIKQAWDLFFFSIILNYLPPSNLPPSNSWFPGFVDVWLTSKAVLVSIICHFQRRNSVESSINTWVFWCVFGFGDDDLIMI